MITSSKGHLHLRFLALTCLALVASCGDTSTVQEVPFHSFGGVPFGYENRCTIQHPIEIGSDPLLERVHVYQLNMATEYFYRLPALDENDYTISESAIPGFTIFSRVRESRTRNTLIIVTAMDVADECRRFTEILVYAQDPETVELQRVEDWPAVAGTDAVLALERIRNECAEMSETEAMRTFGDFGVRATGGATPEITATTDRCLAATQARAYAIRITGPEGDVIVSNVFGEVFVTEIT